ncbi:MAG: hypothetical protein ACK573_05000, partial [Pseudanabaena sp.]
VLQSNFFGSIGVSGRFFNLTRFRNNLEQSLREGLLRKPSLKDCSKLFRTRVKLKNLPETPIEPKKLLCRTT